MAYPTGSGTEILARATIDGQQNDPTAFRWDGTPATVGTETYAVPALHIITVLNISISEKAGTTNQGFYLWMYNGTSDVYIMDDTLLPADSTFIYNDKIVLIGGDRLDIVGYQATYIDVGCNNIDQNWED